MIAEPHRQHYNVTLAILATVGTAFALQQTLVVPALPAFERELHTSTAWATWVLTVFLLVASVATPLLGKLGDQYGKERMLLVSLSLFLAGCVGCSFAWSIASLIGFRALAGAGAAVFPLSFAIIRDEFPPEKVPVAIGLVSAVFGVGGGLGIVLSGVVVDHLSWRWLFILGSVPIALCIPLVHKFVPESPIKTRTRVDFVGAALLSGGLVCLLVALTEGKSWGWSSGRTLGLFAAAAGLLAAWVLAELRVPDPMVDMHVFVHRPVLLTNIDALITGFALFGTFVLIPSFVEMPRDLPQATPELVTYGFNATATQAGLYLLPSSLTLLFAGPLAGVLGRRIGSKWPLSLGLLLSAGSAASFALFHDHPWQILAAMPFLGIGVGFAFAAMATLITAAVRPTETGIATGMNTVMRTVGGVIGGQIGAAILSAHVIAGTEVPTEHAFNVAFGIAAAAAFVGAVIALFVTPLRQSIHLRQAEALSSSPSD